MSDRFRDVLGAIEPERLAARIESVTPEEAAEAIGRERLSDEALPALFSPAAADRIEELARRSAELTLRRFGRTMTLYAPLYLSNECVNRCTYCGFSREIEIPRRTLTPDEVEGEARALRAEGFRHLLLVAGEHPRAVGQEYLEECARRVGTVADSVAIEIEPLDEERYRRLAAVGVDGLALYQECYDPERYRDYHLGGPKRRWAERLDAVEAGGEAGLRSLGIGTLLGLAEPRVEAVVLALHARWLTRRFWRSRIAVSFPRIRPSGQDGFRPPFPVGERELVQFVCAMRLAVPDAELVLSTREPVRVRDGLVGLGITRMSAGSRTDPGGYAADGDPDGEQFAIDDGRSAAEVAAMLSERGIEPVWKDFDRSFVAAP